MPAADGALDRRPPGGLGAERAKRTSPRNMAVTAVARRGARSALGHGCSSPVGPAIFQKR
jgi:hypothetical protein